MSLHTHRLFILLTCICSAAVLVSSSQADPLPGRDLLKFDQQPMKSTNILNTTGVVQAYFGHDELSTAYGVGTAASPPQSYDGVFMADDFADKLSSPVVHVKWWGSYLNNSANVQAPVQKFLIAFESDVPVGVGNPFSHPGQVLQSDVLTLTGGPLTAASGQFTEKLIRGPDPILSESLYEYNGELSLGHAFPELKDTVYWLKIAALVDVPTAVPIPPPSSVTQWGWHNRDYTIQDSLASTLVSPGEYVDGQAGISNINHFQDDAVTGNLRYIPFGVPPNQAIIQNGYAPTFYKDFIDGPGPNGPLIGIGGHSKDLAFDLFTTNPPTPEPASCLLFVCGSLGLALVHRRRRG